MFPSAFVWNINPFSGEILVFQVKLAAILKMADPPIVTHTFSPNKPDFLFIDIHWPPKPLVLEKILILATLFIVHKQSMLFFKDL